MKIVRLLLLVLGILLIALNLLAFILRFPTMSKELSEMDSVAEKAGTIAGSVFIAVVGFILIRISRTIHRKLEYKKARQEAQDFLSS